MRIDQYSVNFQGCGKEPMMSCDWRWPDLGTSAWTMSNRGEDECRWYPQGRLNEEGRQALLKHFGLEELTWHYTLEFIERTSPCELIQARRILEAKHRTRKLEVLSDRIGGHIAPEMAG